MLTCAAAVAFGSIARIGLAKPIGEWNLVFDKVAKDRLHPDPTTLHFNADGTFTMKAWSGKRRSVTAGTYKVEKMEDVARFFLGPSACERVWINASSADGKAIPMKDRWPMPLTWMIRHHSIWSGFDSAFAKSGFQQQVRQMIVDWNKKT